MAKSYKDYIVYSATAIVFGATVFFLKKENKLPATIKLDKRDKTWFINLLESESEQNKLYIFWNEIKELKNDNLQAMFPEYRFFIVQYCQTDPWYSILTGRKSSRAGIRTTKTIAVNFEQKKTVSFYKESQQVDLVKFFAEQGIAIRDLRDATDVSDALTEICQLRFARQGKHVKISENTWHLNETQIGNFQKYWNIKVNNQGIIISGNVVTVKNEDLLGDTR